MFCVEVFSSGCLGYLSPPNTNRLVPPIDGSNACRAWAVELHPVPSAQFQPELMERQPAGQNTGAAIDLHDTDVAVQQPSLPDSGSDAVLQVRAMLQDHDLLRSLSQEQRQAVEFFEDDLLSPEAELLADEDAESFPADQVSDSHAAEQPADNPPSPPAAVNEATAAMAAVYTSPAADNFTEVAAPKPQTDTEDEPEDVYEKEASDEVWFGLCALDGCLALLMWSGFQSNMEVGTCR